MNSKQRLATLRSQCTLANSALHERPSLKLTSEAKRASQILQSLLEGLFGFPVILEKLTGG